MSNSNDKEFRRSRLNIFLGDFYEARRFANYIVNRNLHKSNDRESMTGLKHLAFNTSLIVSYCRPFHGSNDQDGKPRVKLGKTDVAAVLDARESDLHNSIFDKRDRAFAHSDSIAHEIQGWDYSGRAVMLYKFGREPLTKQETQTLRRMIRKWIKHLEELRENSRQ
jgi:hypothetical protein